MNYPLLLVTRLNIWDKEAQQRDLHCEQRLCTKDQTENSVNKTETNQALQKCSRTFLIFSLQKVL